MPQKLAVAKRAVEDMLVRVRGAQTSGAVVLAECSAGLPLRTMSVSTALPPRAQSLQLGRGWVAAAATHGAHILPLTEVMLTDGSVVSCSIAQKQSFTIVDHTNQALHHQGDLHARPVSSHAPQLLAASALAATGLRIRSRPAFAQQLPATPQCHDGDAPTIRQIDGPYFKPSSPERIDLVEPNTKGRLVEISGQVLTRACQPVARALVDVWHADELGEYDNRGFRYRGHLFADDDGRYRVRTIMPALYTGRTRHYHVKVQAPSRPVLTTQLYFPADEPANRRDFLFRQRLVMRIAEAGDGLAARFDFVLDMR